MVSPKIEVLYYQISHIVFPFSNGNLRIYFFHFILTCIQNVSLIHSDDGERAHNEQQTIPIL